MTNSIYRYGYGETSTPLNSEKLQQEALDNKQDKEINKLEEDVSTFRGSKKVSLETLDPSSSYLVLVPTEEIPNVKTLAELVLNGTTIIGVCDYETMYGDIPLELHMSGIIGATLMVFGDDYNYLAFMTSFDGSSNNTFTIVDGGDRSIHNNGDTSIESYINNFLGLEAK